MKIAPGPTRATTRPDHGGQPTAPPPTSRPGATTTRPSPTSAPTTAVPPPGTLPPATTVVGDVERGILEGEGSGRQPSIELIDLDATVNEGDAVVTSGIRESLFPADIPVGRVAEVTRTPGSLQLEVRVALAADLDHLEFVAVAAVPPGRVSDRAA